MSLFTKGSDSKSDLLSVQSQSYLKKRRRATRNIGLNRTNARTAWVFLIPLFLLLFIFLAIPIFNSLRLSVSRWPGVGPVRYVGSDNYHRLLSQGDFFYSARITVLYSFSVAILIVGLAVILASTISAGIRGGRFMKVVWFFPGIAPPTAVAIFWSSSLQPDSGIVNVILRHIGLGGSHALLGSERTALYPVIFVATWASVGFAFLVILGATESVPVSIREAAIIDGANVRQIFTKVTLPLIKPVLLTIFTLEVIWNFNGFTIVWAMTRGGPGVSTEILPIYAYKEAFFFGRFGTAALIAVIAGAFLVIVGAIGTRFSRSAQLE